MCEDRRNAKCGKAYLISKHNVGLNIYQQTKGKSRNPCPRVTVCIFLSSVGINSLIANNVYEAAYPLHDVSTVSVGTLSVLLKNLKATGDAVGGHMRSEAGVNHDIKIPWLVLGCS